MSTIDAKTNDQNQTPEGPYIGVVKPDEALRLIRAENGGWVVFGESGGMGMRDRIVGSFTDGRDMCIALTSAFGGGLALPPEVLK